MSSPWEYLIPLDRKYEAILCLFPLEIVLTGPVEELVEGMLGVGGKPVRLGLGKLRAFLVTGRLGGRYPARSNQFLIMFNNKNTYHLLNRDRFGLINLHCLIHSDHSSVMKFNFLDSFLVFIFLSSLSGLIVQSFSNGLPFSASLSY